MCNASWIKKWMPFVLQGIVSIALLIWIFRNAEFRIHLWNTLISADPVWLVAGISLAGIVNFLCVMRWRVFLRVLKLKTTFLETARIFLAGLFFDTFLMGTFGGDIVRAVLLAAKVRSKSLAMLSVILDRLSGSVAMIFVTSILVGLSLSRFAKSKEVIPLIGFAFLYIIVIAFLLVISLFVASKQTAKRLPDWFFLKKQILEFETNYFQFIACWRESLKAIAMSAIMLLSHFLVYYCSSRAYHTQIPCLHFLTVMPVIDIISGLPISLGGLGVREQLFIILFGKMENIAPATAVAISVCGFLMNSFWGVIGLLAWPIKKTA